MKKLLLINLMLLCSSLVLSQEAYSLKQAQRKTESFQLQSPTLENKVAKFQKKYSSTSAPKIQESSLNNTVRSLANRMPGSGCEVLDQQWETPAPTVITYAFGPGWITGVPDPTNQINPTDPKGIYEGYFSSNPGVEEVVGLRVGLGSLDDADDSMTFQIIIYDDDGFGAPGALLGSTGGFSPTALGVPGAGFFNVYDLYFTNPIVPTTSFYHVGVEIFPGDATDTLIVMTSCLGPAGCPVPQGEGDASNHIFTTGFGYENLLNVYGADFDVYAIPILADTEDPVISCPGNIVSDCSMDPINYTVSALDNCTTLPVSTPAGFTLLGSMNGKTYFLSDASFTGAAALADATAQGGFAATIEDQATQDFLYATLNGAEPYIGFNDAATEGTFEWQSGSTSTYTNWAPGEPNGGVTENYTQIRADGFWNDIQTFSTPYILELAGGIEQTAGLPSGSTFPSGTTTNTFVATDAAGNTATCSFDVIVEDAENPIISCPADIVSDCAANPINYTVTTTDNCSSFPPNNPIPGFTFIGINNNKTYYLSDTPATADVAFTNAIGLGASLATIEDDATNTFVRNATNAQAGAIQLFLGYNDTATEGTFVWQSGSPATYTNWGPGEPNDFAAGEDYTVMTGGGTWNDVPVTFSVRYVIEFFGTLVQTAGLPSGNDFPIGTTTNTFIATDFSGNTDTCSFNVTIIDTTPPTITCPADITQDNDPGRCGAFVNYTIPVPVDDCAPVQPASVQQIDHNYNSSIFCNTGSSHLRIFNLPTEGINTDYLLQNINIGIASSNTTESYDVNIYLADQLENPIQEYVAPLSSQIPPIFSVTNTTPGINTFVDVPVNLFIPTNKTVIVEVYVPVDTNTRAIYNNNNTSETSEGYLNCTGGSFSTPASFGINSGLLIRLDGQEYLEQTTEQTAGLPPNALFPVGTTTNTFLVTDGGGNTATCSFDVTINDTELPEITCPANIVVDNDPGICGALVDYRVLATDNCIDSDIPGFEVLGFSNEKVYYVSDTRFTAPDAYVDAIANGGFVATITDAELNTFLNTSAVNKAISTPLLIGYNDLAAEGTFEWQSGNPATYTNWSAGEPNNSGAGEDYTRMTSAGVWNDVSETILQRYILEVDNALFLNQTAGLATGSEFPVGTTTNTFMFTDPSGNTNSCSFDVTVNDVEIPVAVCQNITVQLDATGTVTIIASDVDGGSTDNCGIVDYQISQDTFTCADLGTPVNITLTVFDDAFNSDSCTATVTVIDVTPPFITCPGDQNESFDVNCEFILPDYTGLATVTDACDTTPAVTQSPAPGTVITGTTIITLTATDASTNAASCTFSVIPEDTTMPSITCPGDQTEDLDGNCEFILPDYTGLAMVTDSCDTNPVVSQSPAAGTVITTTTQITIFAEDASGNINSCAFDVIPVDTTAPTITCPGDQTEVADLDCMLVLPDYTVLATAMDNCGSVSIIQTPAPGTLVGIGTTLITLEASDGSNSSACTFNVLVEDTIPPMAVCMDFTAQLDAAGMVVLTAGDIDGGSTDNCSIASMNVSPNTFSCVDVGTHTVTLTVTDAAGNSSTCDAIVTVEDTIPPTAICQDITISLGTENSITILPGDLDGGSSDNCSVASITASQTTFTCDDIGMNTITVTVTDVNGNTSTCTSIVTVTEDTPPIAICQPFTAQLDAAGMVTILPSDVDGGSTDNCEIDTITLSQDTFDCTHIGENTILMTVTDVSGNSATCTTIVTVEDTIAPDAVCQDITVQLDANGMASIIAADVDGGSSDACGVETIAIDINTFDCSNVGLNNVTLTVTDINGNINTCIAVVTVEEENAVPMAVCRNITVPLQPDGTAVIEASDIDAGSTGGGCVNGVTIDIDTFDCGDVGTPVQVTLSITNGNGDVDTCTAFVNIVDSLDPVITCPEDQVIPGEEAPYTLPDYVALGEVFADDNCLDVTSIIQTPPPGTVLDLGEYNIDFVATDPSGNEASCFFRLTIEDEVLEIPTQASLATLSIFPNPASTLLNLSNPDQIDLQKVQLYDVTGRLIKTFKLDSATEHQMDISELASATYLLLITAENGQITKQIVKE